MKKCCVCKDKFNPFNSMQKVCSTGCAIKYAESSRIRKEKADNKLKRESIKARSELLSETQTEFNKYIRERDKEHGCISCGAISGQFHAGHYRTVGAHPELRFDEDNCHKQCARCNNYMSGNIVDYRINLKAKIGEERLDVLEGYHTPLKLELNEIRELKTFYKNKLKNLKS